MFSKSPKCFWCMPMSNTIVLWALQMNWPSPIVSSAKFKMRIFGTPFNPDLVGSSSWKYSWVVRDSLPFILALKCRGDWKV